MGYFADIRGNLMGNRDHETETKMFEFINGFISSDKYNEALFGFITAGTQRNLSRELIEDIDNNKFKSIQDIRNSLIPIACTANNMLGIAHEKLIELKKSTTIQ